MTVQIVVKPIGILNRPNQNGEIPPGAMFDASNVYLRRSGILEPAPVLTTFGTFGSLSITDDPAFLVPVDDTGVSLQRVLCITEDGVSIWIRSDGGSTVMPQGWQTYTTLTDLNPLPNRPFFSKVRDRLILLSNYGPVVHDNLDPNDTPSFGSPRFPGAPAPSWASITTAPTANAEAPYAAEQTASYRTIVRRVYPDGYTLLSEPSAPLRVFSSVGPSRYYGFLQLEMPGFTIAGLDTLEVYRTYIRDDDVDPGPVFYLVKSIPRSQQGAGFFNAEDWIKNTQLSQELYTNPGQETEEGSNRIPPRANNIATYKGYTFYADVTQPPKVTLTIPWETQISSTGDRRATCIGSRLVTGTTTSASPSVTAISAADIVGLRIGQLINSTRFTFPAYITAVGATSITVNKNASASGAAHVFTATDTLSIRGNPGQPWSWDANAEPIYLYSPAVFAGDMANRGFVVHADQAVSDAAQTVTFTLEPAKPVAAFGFDPLAIELIATNGQNLSPQLPVPTAWPISSGTSGYAFPRTRERNAFMFSKFQEPEAVPVSNRGRCGSGTILGLDSTRDALWFHCTDGLWRLSGSGGDFRLDPVDSTLNLTGPQSHCVLRDAVFAYTNQGLIRISSDLGIELLSQARVNELQGSPYAEEQGFRITYDEKENEILFAFLPNATGNGTLSQWWIYNANTDAFTKSTTSTQTLRNAACFAKSGFNGGEGGVLWAGRTSSVSTAPLAITQLPRTYQGTGIAVQYMNFMPIAGSDPRTVKQWINAVHMFLVNNASSDLGPFVDPIWNELLTSSGSAVSTGLTPDSRVTRWVPRAAAINAMIKVGLQVTPLNANARVWQYQGFAIEYVDLTTQQKARR